MFTPCGFRTRRWPAMRKTSSFLLASESQRIPRAQRRSGGIHSRELCVVDDLNWRSLSRQPSLRTWLMQPYSRCRRSYTAKSPMIAKLGGNCHGHSASWGSTGDGLLCAWLAWGFRFTSRDVFQGLGVKMRNQKPDIGGELMGFPGHRMYRNSGWAGGDALFQWAESSTECDLVDSRPM